MEPEVRIVADQFSYLKYLCVKCRDCHMTSSYWRQCHCRRIVPYMSLFIRKAEKPQHVTQIKLQIKLRMAMKVVL